MKPVHLELRPAGGKCKLPYSTTGRRGRSLAKRSVGMTAPLMTRTAIGQNGKTARDASSERVRQASRAHDRQAPDRGGSHAVCRLGARLVRRRLPKTGFPPMSPIIGRIGPAACRAMFRRGPALRATTNSSPMGKPTRTATGANAAAVPVKPVFQTAARLPAPRPRPSLRPRPPRRPRRTTGSPTDSSVVQGGLY